jgi:hypothetical protein
MSAKSKLKALKASWTVRFSALIPVLLAAAESAKEVIPVAGLSGWTLVAASSITSAVVIALRLRSVVDSESADK